MDVSKCTPGPAKVYRQPDGTMTYWVHSGDGDMIAMTYTTLRPESEYLANAALIAEAFTVCVHEEHLSPRQLAEQRDRAKQRLNDILGHAVERDSVRNDYLLRCIEADAKAALAEIEQERK